MKPVDMTIMHNPPDAVGDCFRCTLASILEVPPDQVPHFASMIEDGQDIRPLVREWLRPQGMFYFEIEWSPDELENWRDHFAFHHVITGRSPRSTMHSCVGFAGKVVHDPHPSRAGLVPDEGMWRLGFVCKG